ncbi:MAG: hypothetical protein OJF51_000608 [Nitrospira sp.]|jgi:mannose-6-phosphate isomerase-like protein (cupin superfamily)|nr:MAG: hypothetical protein OJF51_000608 [Nitrospira sp.]
MSFDLPDVILGPGQGRTIHVPQHPITYKARKEETRGAYALLEVIVAGEGPPQHIHHAEEEAFYILEGELNVQVGQRIVKGTAGSFILVPRGTVHTYWKVGSAPAKLLVIISPPGFEQYFIDVVGDEEIDDMATFIKRGMAVAQKYHLEIVGPPRG